MKQRFVKPLAAIILFLLLMVGLCAAVRPVYRRVSVAIRTCERNALSALADTTGLAVSYQSLSPSILAGIRIKNISVSDVATGTELVAVKNAVVGYRLFSLLRQDWKHAFTGVTINGVTVEYNETSEPFIVQQLKLRGGALPAQSADHAELGMEAVSASADGEVPFVSEATLDRLRSALFLLPFLVKIKNTTIHYKDSSTDVQAVVDMCQFARGHDSDSLATQLRGHVFARLSSLGGKTVGCTFGMNGQILESFSGSSAIVTLGDYSRVDYSVRKTEFLLRYRNRRFSLQSAHNLQPFSVYASLDIDNGDCAVRFKSARFDPFLLVRMPPLTGALKVLSGTTVTSDISGQFNVLSRDFSWKANGGLSLSRRIVPSGEYVSFDVSGDAEKILVAKLSANGELLGADFTGMFSIPDRRPSGVLELDHYVLPNGGRLGGELYIDPLKDGFTCFVPQLFLGEQTLTALQLTLIPDNDYIDFSYEMSDFSHLDFDEPGSLRIDGSFMRDGTRFMQASVSLNSFFLDTLAGAVAFFVDTPEKQSVGHLVQGLSPFVCSNELYVSTDFKSISFNSPFSIIANTQKDRQFLTLSFDGNERSVRVTSLDLLYGKQSVAATVSADISPEDRQVLFLTDCIVNGIPYHLDGSFTNGNVLSLTGDYGFDAQVLFEKDVSGFARLSSLPFLLGGYMCSLSLDTYFSYSADNGLAISLNNCTLDEVGGKLSIQPRVGISGSVNRTGMVLNTVSYSDTLSVVNGRAELLWSINNGVFDSLSLLLDMGGSLSNERVNLNASVSNPLKKTFSLSMLKEDCYFSAEAQISSFPLGRVLKNQMNDDTLSATVTASGTMENPYVTVDIAGLSAQVAGQPLRLKAGVALVDGTVSIPSLEARWSQISVQDFSASVDMREFDGTASATVSVAAKEKDISVPFRLALKNLSSPLYYSDAAGSAQKIPEAFSVSLDTQGFEGSPFGNNVPLHALLLRTPGRFDLTTDDALGFTAYRLDDGRLSAWIDKSKPIHMNLDGTMKGLSIDWRLSGIFVDVPTISSFINNYKFSIYKGVAKGNLHISGLITDPAIVGKIDIEKAECNMPKFVPQHMTAHMVPFVFTADDISMQPTVFQVGSGRAEVSARAILERWKVGQAQAFVRTLGAKGIPADVKVSKFRVKGMAQMKLDVLLEDNVINVDGTLTLRNSEITLMNGNSVFSGIPVISNIVELFSGEDSSASAPSRPGTRGIRANLDFLVGQKVQVVLNPFLRGLVAPNTPVSLALDTESEQWNVKGDVVLRGGELTYLSRSFYLKEGRVVLNETQDSFDPNLTIRAETREHDENGESVTITLSAIRQNLSQFSPNLYATPAKSENEIMALLGNIVTGDSDSVGNFGLSLVDYGVQVTLLRKIENALRDLCNFDIFSVRTSVLQNAIRIGLGQNTSNSAVSATSKKSYSIGNYFDNSTVYIGKYFGSTLYADAMLHWTYDETREDGVDTVGGLVFQPEIGLELASPFANIRWSFAPDLGNVLASWVSSTSITLSWRLTF